MGSRRRSSSRPTGKAKARKRQQSKRRHPSWVPPTPPPGSLVRTGIDKDGRPFVFAVWPCWDPNCDGSCESDRRAG